MTPETHRSSTPSATSPSELNTFPDSNMELPTPTATPQKRKASDAEDEISQKKLKITVPEPVMLAEASNSAVISNSEKHYGVYLQDNPVTDPTSWSRIFDTLDLETVYLHINTDATQRLDSHPEWGATRTIIWKNQYTFIDATRRVRLRYDIASITSKGVDEHGTRIWVREIPVPEAYEACNAPLRYGLFVNVKGSGQSMESTSATDDNDNETSGHVFIGSFEHHFEVRDAMRKVASPYLYAYEKVTLEENKIQLMNKEGIVKKRYTIEKGRFLGGLFVTGGDCIDGVTSPSPPSLPRCYATPSMNEHESLLELPVGIEAQIREDAAPSPYTTIESDVAESDETNWCTCGTSDDGSLMLCCENEDCQIQWYHGRCLGIEQAPLESEKWWCPTCAAGVTVELKKGGKRTADVSRKRGGSVGLRKSKKRNMR